MNARYEMAPSTAPARATTTTSGTTAQRRKTSPQMAGRVRTPAPAAALTMARCITTTGATRSVESGTTAGRSYQTHHLQVYDKRDRPKSPKKKVKVSQPLSTHFLANQN